MPAACIATPALACLQHAPPRLHSHACSMHRHACTRMPAACIATPALACLQHASPLLHPRR
eukprot:232278-Chlamydomonas_euryale.AAC.1